MLSMKRRRTPWEEAVALSAKKIPNEPNFARYFKKLSQLRVVRRTHRRLSPFGRFRRPFVMRTACSAAPPPHGGWLSSRQWLDKARGAYFAGRIHSADLQEPLIEAIREATALRNATMGPRSCRGAGIFVGTPPHLQPGGNRAQTKMRNEPNMDRNLKKPSRFYRSASRAFPSLTAFSMSFNP